MNNIECNHIDIEGNSSLLFPEYRYKGMYNRQFCGICSICGEPVKISEEEYKKIERGYE